jgi:putative SOS response-associated peptidase YedK
MNVFYNVRPLHPKLYLHQVHKFLSVFGAPQNLRPHYNIAPTTMIDVVRLDREGKRELVPKP